MPCSLVERTATRVIGRRRIVGRVARTAIIGRRVATRIVVVVVVVAVVAKYAGVAGVTGAFAAAAFSFALLAACSESLIFGVVGHGRGFLSVG